MWHTLKAKMMLLANRFNRFESVARRVAKKYRYVAVCRQHYGPCKVFYVVFNDDGDLFEFMMRSEYMFYQDPPFYARAYENGKFNQDNT